jgi:hypothetical protein
VPNDNTGFLVTARTIVFSNGGILQAIPYLIDLQIT